MNKCGRMGGQGFYRVSAAFRTCARARARQRSQIKQLRVDLA